MLTHLSRRSLLIVGAVVALAACSTPADSATLQREELPTSRQTALDTSSFMLRSPAIDRGTLAIESTCDGTSTSPGLQWTGAPAGTVGYAVVMHHITDVGEVHTYWVLYDLAASVDHVDTGALPAASIGINSVNSRSEYAPPCSKGPGAKVYTVTLYALSGAPDLPNQEAVTRDVLLAAINDLVLDEAHIDATYARSEFTS
jgi:phosphatidylethanolamine-binding protein (PEBP) family uncharacterized protein